MTTSVAVQQSNGTEALDEFRLPDQQQTREVLRQVQQFQTLIRSSLTQGHDYGVIPGTQKPTLLKPGAEKIAKLLGLADTYEVLEQTADWDSGLFQYIVRASLVSIKTGQVVAQGMGECNSHESRYRYRWVWPRELALYGYESGEGLRARTTKNGGKQYRVENDDPADQVNTILKIAKKRSLVDAALSVGSLSDLFTQDVEETASVNVDQNSGVQATGPGPQRSETTEPAPPSRVHKWQARLANASDPKVAAMGYPELKLMIDDLNVSEARAVRLAGMEGETFEGVVGQMENPPTYLVIARVIIDALIAEENK